MRIAICDDEKEYLLFIKEYIMKILLDVKEDIFIDTYISGKELLKRFNEYQILILDINMPEISGFELSKKIRETNEEIKIIFLTAIMQYVFESLKVTPFRYILKNRIHEDLPEAVLKAYEKITLKSSQFYVFSYKSQTYSLPVSEILYFEFANRLIHVHTNEKVYKFYGILNELEAQLQYYDFIRNHSGYLVNLKNVSSISVTELILKNGQKIPVSNNRYRLLKKRFFEFIRQEALIQ